MSGRQAVGAGLDVAVTPPRQFHEATWTGGVAQACEHREDWYDDQIQLIAEDATPGTLTATKRRMGPLLRQLVRLRHRPGAVHRKAGAGSVEPGGG